MDTVNAEFTRAATPELSSWPGVTDPAVAAELFRQHKAMVNPQLAQRPVDPTGVVQNAPPVGPSSEELQQIAAFDKVMAVPESGPDGYRLDYGIRPPEPTPESMAADSAFREAMFAVGAPQFIVRNVHDAITTLGAKFGNASARDIDAHGKESLATLRARWGGEFDTRMAAVDTVIGEAIAKQPLLRQVLAGAPYLTESVEVLEALWQLAETRPMRAGNR